MKFLKLVLIFLFVFLNTSFITISDVNENTIIYDEGYSQSYDVEPYIQWSPSGVGYWTQNTNYYIYNDFDWMISRSVNTFNGYYYFDFWFFSQSYYWDGYNASYTSTNLRNVNVYVDGDHYTSDYSTLGITFNQTYNATSLRIITKNPQPSIYFKWDSMNAK
jgi:hypothetical protein